MFEGKKAVDLYNVICNSILVEQANDETVSASMLNVIALSLARLSDDIHELLDNVYKETKNGKVH